MPRKKTYRNSAYPYHVTARCTNKEWFAVPMPRVWEIFSNYLHFVSHAYDVQIHSFVLMSNHFHMLISTPNANIDQAMNYLLREVSRQIGKESDRINQIFGGPYHWTIISNSIYYQHAYKYIYRNPVHAGLCERVEEYPFSTLRGLLGKEHLTIPAIDNLSLIQDCPRQLEWLNNDYIEEYRLSIQTALKHNQFSFPANEADGRAHPLENLIV